MMKHLLTTTAAAALLVLAGAAHAKMIGDADVRLLPPPAHVYATTPPVKPWGIVFSDVTGSGTLQQYGYSQDPFVDYLAFKGITPYIAAKSLSTAYPTIVYEDVPAGVSADFVMGYMDASEHVSGYMIAPDGSETRVFTFSGKEFAKKFGVQDLKTSNHVRITASAPFNQVRWSVRNSTFEFAPVPAN